MDKFWKINMKADEKSEAELVLYGDVVEKHPTDWWTGQKEPGNFIAQDEFLKDMERLKDVDNLTVRINSGGGDLYTGMAIYTLLKSMKATVTVVVEGIAASAASLIASAGDVVKMAASGLFMIHEPAVVLWDSYKADDLQEIVNMLDTAGKAAAEAYAKKTGLTTKEVRKMMQAETWMTGREAMEKGFVNELLFEETQMSMAMDKKAIVVNGTSIGIEHFKNVPEQIKALSGKNAVENKTKGGAEIMKLTVEMVQKEAPEVYEEIMNMAKKEPAKDSINQAVMAERNRIKEIEEISNQCSAEMVNEAKYGETACTAQELALRAMKKSSEAQAAFLQANANDTANSGTEDVAGAPHSQEEPSAEDVEKQELEMAARLIAGKKEE